MAVALDNASEASGTGNLQVYSHTCTNTSQDGYLLIGISGQSGIDFSAFNVVYNSVPLELLDSRSGTLNDSSVWGLKNPSTGSNFVGIGTGGPSESFYSCAVSFTGVDEEAPIENSAKANGTSTKTLVQVLPLQTGNRVVDFVSASLQISDPTVGSGQTLIISGQSPAGFQTGAGMSYKDAPSGGLQSMTWDVPVTGDWTNYAFVLRAAKPRMKWIGVDKVIFS